MSKKINDLMNDLMNLWEKVLSYDCEECKNHDFCLSEKESKVIAACNKCGHKHLICDLKKGIKND